MAEGATRRPSAAAGRSVPGADDGVPAWAGPATAEETKPAAGIPAASASGFCDESLFTGLLGSPASMPREGFQMGFTPPCAWGSFPPGAVWPAVAMAGP